MSVTITEFADRINDLMPVMIKEFAKRQVNEFFKGKITLPQFLILDFLEKNGESKMTDLAHFVSVSTAAMTGMVDRLVNYGYAARESELHDRRVIKIKLNLRGNRLVKKINQQRRNMIIDVFGRVSETDRSDYLRVLMKIKEVLTKNRK